ncbi:Protein kinase-like domain containing protein [Tylopilus felleus]
MKIAVVVAEAAEMLAAAHILQCLQGHPAIPSVYGYGQLEHFEYLAMEPLGPSVTEQLKDGAAVMVKTIIQLLDQSLRALQHIHSLRIVHWDVKPENILCMLDNPATIKFIYFCISKPFSSEHRSKYDPLKDHRHVVGSLYWASLNSHNGEDLAPHDDLESLAYVALFLLRGNLPWKPHPRFEPQLHSQEVIQILKSAYSGPALSAGFPNEFGKLLTYSHSLTYDQLPDYDALRASFADLEPGVLISDEDTDEDKSSNCDDDLGEDSDFGWDIDIWDHQGERDKDLTLPAEQEVELDKITPVIGEVEQD